MRHFLFATIGSLGDLHPLIAIALKLREQTHLVSFCTSEMYRGKLEELGFPFYPLRPNVAADTPEMLQWSREIMDAKRGPETLLKDFLFPRVREMYVDLDRALNECEADLLLSSEIVYAAPLIAEKRGIRWASCVLSPMSFFSASDPPVLPPVPRLSRFLFSFGPVVSRPLIRIIKARTRSWSRPLRRLRAELGLGPGADPIYEGKHSPGLVLVLYSNVMGEAQPDWPSNAVMTGFAFHDELNDRHAAKLEAFLAEGTPPIVFTLGSAAVYDPRNFYQESAGAAEKLGRRAVLLVGKNLVPENLPVTVAAFDYLPFATVFPRASAVVHQGGIGTTGQALRAGRPMLIMPYSHDQPDNAHRITKLKVGRVIGRSEYSAARAARELDRLLNDPEYERRAAAIRDLLAKEDGAGRAARALEEFAQE